MNIRLNLQDLPRFGFLRLVSVFLPMLAVIGFSSEVLPRGLMTRWSIMCSLRLLLVILASLPSDSLPPVASRLTGA